MNLYRLKTFLQNQSYLEIRKLFVSIFDYEEGDIFFLYTDGINEARHPVSKEEYGYDRIKTFVEENAHCSVSQIAELVIDDIYQFIEGDDLRDDYTVMVMRFD